MARWARMVFVVGAVMLAVPAVAAAAPTASLTVSQYSRLLSGNIGEAVGGVTVTASLQRQVAGQPVTIATGKGTTDAQGDWTATLTSIVPSTIDTYGQSGDAIALSYSGPSGTTLPANGTFGGPGFLGESTTISPDGTQINAGTPNGCTGVTFLINGTVAPEQMVDGNWCEGLPTKPITDANLVLLQYTSTVTDSASGAQATMTTNSKAGLVGVGSGIFGGGGVPTCGADLATTVVTCVGLDAGQYTLTSSSGHAYPLASSEITYYQGLTDYRGTATVLGLNSGQSFKLTRSGLSRTLATFTIPRMVDHIGLSGSETVGCTPFKLITPQNVVCPQSGVLSGLSGGPETVSDESSGASATATIPTLSDLIPAQDASVPGADFFAYATLSGVGNSTQVLREFRSVTFSVITHNGTKTVSTGAMTLAADSMGDYGSVEVKNIPAGLYWGRWTMTDRNGDSRVYENLFAAQPPSAGARAVSLAAYRRGAGAARR